MFVLVFLAVQATGQAKSWHSGESMHQLCPFPGWRLLVSLQKRKFLVLLTMFVIHCCNLVCMWSVAYAKPAPQLPRCSLHSLSSPRGAYTTWLS
jgi:hypothetical protein